MPSEDTSLITQAQRLHNGLSPLLLFQDDRFGCGLPQRRAVGDPEPKTTRELTGFIDDWNFQPQGTEFRRSLYRDASLDRQDHRVRRNWDGNGRMSMTPSSDGSEEDEEEDEVDVHHGLDAVDDSRKKNNSSNTSGRSIVAGDNGKLKHLSSFDSSRGVMVKEGNKIPSINVNNSMRASWSENNQQGRVGQYQGALTLEEPDGELYYTQYLQRPDGTGSGQKDMTENGCGFSGRKYVSYLSESGDSSRAILSDKLTKLATLVHNQSEHLVAPNLSLRAAVQAFRRIHPCPIFLKCENLDSI